MGCKWGGRLLGLVHLIVWDLLVDPPSAVLGRGRPRADLEVRPADLLTVGGTGGSDGLRLGAFDHGGYVREELL